MANSEPAEAIEVIVFMLGLVTLALAAAFDSTAKAIVGGVLIWTTQYKARP